MSDADLLEGYIKSSRYLSCEVFYKYGLHPGMYESRRDVSRLNQLKLRIEKLLHDNEFVVPTTGNELRKLLGDDFEWVKSSLDDKK